ncbi:hypothetical protein DL766_005734 [Monosporascus sp. MC13-8B]|nr:hypothetical protein DL766_005734 [Monosporascus sp. MC13-8B]
MDLDQIADAFERQLEGWIKQATPALFISPPSYIEDGIGPHKSNLNDQMKILLHDIVDKVMGNMAERVCNQLKNETFQTNTKELDAALALSSMQALSQSHVDFDGTCGIISVQYSMLMNAAAQRAQPVMKMDLATSALTCITMAKGTFDPLQKRALSY